MRANYGLNKRKYSETCLHWLQNKNLYCKTPKGTNEAFALGK